MDAGAGRDGGDGGACRWYDWCDFNADLWPSKQCLTDGDQDDIYNFNWLVFVRRGIS